MGKTIAYIFFITAVWLMKDALQPFKSAPEGS